MKSLMLGTVHKISKILPILVIVLLLQILAVPSFPEVRAASSVPSLRLKHSIQVKNGGFVIVNETVMLFNNSTDSISNLQMGFQKDFASKLNSVNAFGSDGRKLAITQNITMEEKSIYWVDISFDPIIVNPNEAYNFSLIYFFSGLIRYNASDNIYEIAFPKYPALTVDAESCEVDVIIPTGTTLNQSSWDSLPHIEKALKADSNETGYAFVIGDILLISGSSASREMRLDAYGYAIFYDSYSIRNIGNARFSSIDFNIPKEAEDLTVYDSQGPLSFSLSEAEKVKVVNVGFRYPLRGEEEIEYYDAASITLEYKASVKNYTTQESLSTYQLRTKLFISADWPIRDLTVKIALPEGAEFLQSSPIQNTLSRNSLTQSATYVIHNPTYIQNFDVIVKYNYIIFWSAFRPTLYLGIILAVMGAVIMNRRRRKMPVPVATSDENIELIKTFAEICDEKIALRSEIRTLEKDVEENRIKRKDYNRRRRILDQRLQSADREFTNLKESVKQIKIRYGELVNRMEAAEMEVKAAEGNIISAENQHRLGRLSRSAYEKLRNDYERRIERAKVTIEGIVLELKGDAG